MKKERRTFLRTAAAVTAGLAAPCDPDAEARAAQATPGITGGLVTPGSNAAIPMLRVGKYSVSRLIVGGNPLHGYSHFNRILDRHMTEWADRERVSQILKQCEQQGINTWQFSHHERGMGDLERYRETGGKIQFILLSHREIEDDHRIIKDVAKLGPVAIVHHGGSAERKRRAGQLGKIRDFLKAVRDNGVLAGLSTHDPRFLEQAEAENWETDLYMTSLYYLTRSAEEFAKLLGTRPIGEIYLPEDPARMCAAIRQTPKTCLAYKVLAAGRLTDSSERIDQAFRFAYENIKPNDGLIVGMYPKYSDQIAENAARVRQICGAMKS
ncbi:MAG: hypothetical protein KIT09_28335 [Bryobacteraceae bacterium]|nr:hypothetical protein [Bryobacteraceae bacterium]